MKKTLFLTAPALALFAAAGAAAMDQTGGGGSSAASQQQAPGLSQLPQQGQMALLKEAVEHEGRVTDVDRKSTGGQSYYVAKLKNQDHDWTVKLSETGSIVEVVPHRTSWESVPQPVRDAALQELQKSQGSQSGSQSGSSSSSGSAGSSSGSSGGQAQSGGSQSGGSQSGSQSASQPKITEIVAIRRNGQQAYCVEIEQGSQGRDVVFSSDGQRLPTENPMAQQQVQQLMTQIQQQSSQTGGASSQTGGAGSSQSGGSTSGSR
jgi:hypothetical protein